MNGEGEPVVQPDQSDDDVDLPSTLAQLDDPDPAEQRRAVDTVRDAVETQPMAVVPTVPKLRELLSRETVDCHEQIAYCLAELATASPDDVAPSVATLVEVSRDNATTATTGEILRCLSAVATERPDAVAKHVPGIVATLEERGPTDRWGIATLSAVTAEYPEAAEPATPVFEAATRTGPETAGAAALSGLGRLARVGATTSSSFVDVAGSLADHETPSVRRNAVGCLADASYRYPAAVERWLPTVAEALESGDPVTRSNAAVVVARIEADGRTVNAGADRLIALLSDDDADVRANACVAVGWAAVDGARDPLSRVCEQDPEPGVRERASWALAQLS
ncbi:HEAT repeat domain-containing protein [Halobacteria archaeon AArc-dxtr1]|nr:HEAT repeat domain-containing protein [Halobacteria archaeon AArc-dxtr1]